MLLEALRKVGQVILQTLLNMETFMSISKLLQFLRLSWLCAAGGAMHVCELPDDALRCVLRCLSPVDLLRSAAVCRRW